MRTKLAAVLLVPAIAFLVIASINMATQIGSARDYGRGANVAEFGRQASTLVHELQAERDIAAGWVAEGRRPSNQKRDRRHHRRSTRTRKNAQNQKQLPLPSDLNALQAQQHNVDVALSAYQSADASLGDVSPEAQAAIDAARAQLAGLPQLRQALDRQLLTQDAITGKYTAMITRPAEHQPPDRRGHRQHRAEQRGRRPHRARRPEGDAVPGACAALQRHLERRV